MNIAWVFNSVGGRFPGGVFSERKIAEEWIEQHGLTGTLTAYPVDQGCFDWAVNKGLTNMKNTTFEAKRNDPAFIGGFTTASQEHYHYEEGRRGG